MSEKENEISSQSGKQSGSHFANGGAHGSEIKSTKARKALSSNANSRTNSRENSIERSKKDDSSSTDRWECDTCRKQFVNKDDQLLSCEYCGSYRCIQCLGINKTVYRGISGRPDLPWFCTNCVVKSLESLRQTKTIEDKCREFIAEFQQQVENRMDKIEGEVMNMRSDIATMKVDIVNEVKDTLLKDSATRDLSSTGSSSTVQGALMSGTTENVSTETIVKKAANEMQARLARKDNIAFYNVQESTSNLKEDIIREDKQAIIEICDEMEVRVYEEDILNLKRVGKKHQKRKVHGEEKEVPRLLIVTFQEATKVKIMKNAYKLNNSENDYFKKIGIKHDMTKDERSKDLELKKEAKSLQENQAEGEDFLFLVRGLPWERRIIKRKKRGASGEEPLEAA